MNKKQHEILNEVKDKVEIIESARYNSEDPIIEINKADSQEMIMVKVLSSERTGAMIKFEGELINTAEKKAERLFGNGVRTLNSWQFRNSLKHFTESANLARSPLLQQRINLYKQLHSLLKATIRTAPERIIKSKGAFFEEVLDLLKKYDQFTQEEKNHYLRKIDALYGVCRDLEKDDAKTLTQQLFIRCSIALFNQEYLAAYIWLYRIYLLVQNQFDAIAENDKILKIALDNLKLYIEVETGLKQIEDLPTMASAFDLQTVFADHLSNIFDVEYQKEVSMRFSIPVFRK